MSGNEKLLNFRHVIEKKLFNLVFHITNTLF